MRDLGPKFPRHEVEDDLDVTAAASDLILPARARIARSLKISFLR